MLEGRKVSSRLLIVDLFRTLNCFINLWTNMRTFLLLAVSILKQVNTNTQSIPINRHFWPEQYGKSLNLLEKSASRYIKNARKIRDYEKLLNTTNYMTSKISNSKKNDFDNFLEKLCDPKLNRKTYWGILKCFANWEKNCSYISSG